MSLRSLPVPAIALGMLLGAPAAASGAGETYVVVQCHPQNLGALDAQFHEPRAYGITNYCSDAASENAIQINSRLRADRGKEGSITWLAPPDTGFVRVRAEAKLRRDAGHYARLFMADEKGRETRRIATGDNSPGAFHQQLWDGNREDAFVAALGCDEAGGCPHSTAAKTWIREVRMTLADYSDPEVQVGGSLVEPGWKRGIHALSFQGEDSGSGLRSITVTVNGSRLQDAGNGQCEGVLPDGSAATRLAPCVSEIQSEVLALDTGVSPFHDGQNSVVICAHDFAGNEGCDSRMVRADNASPALAFTSAQDPEDPELIHAVVSDEHSGVANGQISYRLEGADLWQPLETVVEDGELQARVDSSAVPAGTYEFRATARDSAGNEVESTRREDGLLMRLTFPLKAGVDLAASLQPGGSKRLTLGYGKRSRVKGVLRDASGTPIPGQEIVVEEFFGEGALIRERITRVETDGRGRWRSKLPAGPSRRVTASFSGTQRYLAESTLGGRLAVRTKASLRTSKSRVPEGGKVIFRGRLGRIGARIPTGGKLLELQVKQDGNTYQTVGQGFRSGPSGRYKVPYRFGRFYQYDVRFKFRLKVARESDWPYKAPVRSRGRTVTVLDR